MKRLITTLTLLAATLCAAAQEATLPTPDAKTLGMGGVDLIVFTGGVGENSCEMRETVCTGLEFMGVEFDRAANKGARGVDKILSKPSSRVKVAVIATDEELVIATDTYNLVK